MSGQIGRFIIVGILNTAIDFGLFNLLLIQTNGGNFLSLILINLAAVSAAIINSFVINRIWTFRSADPDYGSQLSRFLFVSFTGMLINTSVVALFSLLPPAQAASPYIMLNLGKLAAAVFSATWNFAFYRNWVFKPEQAGTAVPLTPPVLGLTSLIIPAYNEEARLPRRLHDLLSDLPPALPLEIIVVDDGSRDATKDEAALISKKYPQLSCISYPRNQGKGNAVRTGIKAARGEYLIFTDADDTFSAEHIQALRHQLISGNKIAIARRSGGGLRRTEGEGRHRRLMGWFFNLIVQALLLPGIKDSQCGLKGFHYQAARDIFSRQRLNRFAFDVEVLALGRALQYEIAELPLQIKDSPGSRVNPWLAPGQMLLDLIRIKIALLFNTYALPGGHKMIRQAALLTAAFAAALALRLPWLWEIPRFIDELKEVQLSYLIYEGQLLPLHNAAWDIGSMHNYIIAGLFKILGPSIYLPRFYVAVTAALTVPLLYILGTKLYGRKTGILAAALLLANGMHILVTHMAWANCTTPFFFTLALLVSLIAEEKKSGSWLVTAALAWAAALQTHSSVIIYVLAVTVYFLQPSVRRRLQLNRRWYYGAVLAFLAGYSNMIYFNLISLGGSFRWLSHKTYTLEQDPGLHSYLSNCAHMFVELIRTLSSTYNQHDYLLSYLAYPQFSLAIILLLAGSILAWKQKKTLPLWFIIAGFMVIPILNERYSFFVNTRYIMPVFICALLLSAYGAVYFYETISAALTDRKRFQTAALTVALLIASIQFIPYYNYCRSKEITNESNRLALDIISQAEKLTMDSSYLVLLDKQLDLENDPLPLLLGFNRHPFAQTTIPSGLQSPDDLDLWLSSLSQNAGKIIAVLTDESYAKLDALIKPNHIDSFSCMITFPRPSDEERRIYVVEMSAE